MAAPNFDAQDVQQNKALGGLGYLLFFVPLIACPNSKYGRYCANQGLLFLIVMFALWAVFGLLGWILGWVPLVGWLISVIGWLLQSVVVLLDLYYVFQAMSSGATHEFPIIGQTQILK